MVHGVVVEASINATLPRGAHAGLLVRKERTPHTPITRGNAKPPPVPLGEGMEYSILGRCRGERLSETEKPYHYFPSFHGACALSTHLLLDVFLVRD